MIGFVVTGEQGSRVLNAVPLHILQFHGDATPAFCSGWSVVKAIAMNDGVDLLEENNRFHQASTLWIALTAGNLAARVSPLTGVTLPEMSDRIVLAGGLNVQNVAKRVTGEACKRGLSSGVGHSKGIKDRDRLRRLSMPQAAHKRALKRFVHRPFGHRSGNTS